MQTIGVGERGIVGVAPPVKRQSPQLYCFEFGVAIVWNIVIPSDPTSQKIPRQLLNPWWAFQAAVQACSPAMTAAGFWLASYCCAAPPAPAIPVIEFPG